MKNMHGKQATGEAAAFCPHARACGGCAWAGVPYEQQLERKQRALVELFDGVAGEECLIHPILGMDDPLGYRAKIVSPFAPAPGKGKRVPRNALRTGRGGMVAARRELIRCGLYAAGSHRIVDIESCPVEHPVGRQVVAAVRALMARFGMEPYNEDAGTGFVRHVVVRVGAQSGEVLATVVTNGREFVGAKNFCRELVRAVPAVTTVVQNVNTSSGNVILGSEERVLYGPGFILDTLCGLSFRISSHSFYQTNARQTELLYRRALDFAGLTQLPRVIESGESPLIVDAYCGTGTIGIVAASAAPGAQVVGVDKVESAIRDARQNAAHNGIANARFVAADAGDYLASLAAQGSRPGVLFLDPPRAGASEQFLRAAASCAPERIVYISCNPNTQLRDVELLQTLGYKLTHLQAVDMFPHTPHAECIALLSPVFQCAKREKR